MMRHVLDFTVWLALVLSMAKMFQAGNIPGSSLSSLKEDAQREKFKKLDQHRMSVRHMGNLAGRAQRARASSPPRSRGPGTDI
jgi:hypothetical protein